MYRARTALAEAAPEARVVQPEVVAQSIKQRHMGVIDLDRLRLAIDSEGDALSHSVLPESADRSTLLLSEALLKPLNSMRKHALLGASPQGLALLLKLSPHAARTYNGNSSSYLRRRVCRARWHALFDPALTFLARVAACLGTWAERLAG